MPHKQFETSTDQSITDVIRKNNPKTVKELIKLLQQKYPIPQQEILEHIQHLKKQGRIVLKERQAPSPSLLKDYISSAQANWYWTVIAAAIATMTLVLIVPENSYPIVYARYLFGSIVVLFLPGYSLIKALFPTKELDNIERTTLSIGISLALVLLIGLLLNYTPWGIRTTPVTLSLLALTIALSTAASIREHQAERTSE